MPKVTNPALFITEVDEFGRVCSICTEYKPWSDYQKVTRAKTGHASKCKQCTKEKRKPTLVRTKKPNNSNRQVLKKSDPYSWKSGVLRGNLLRRGRALGLDTPSKAEILDWLKSQSLVCHYSGEVLTINTINVDHKVPLKRGGSNQLSNLCLASHHMNSAKGTMTELEFKELLSLLSTWEDKGKSVLTRLKLGYFS